MNFKKLLALGALSLCAWFSIGIAQAVGFTNYDFTATFSNNSPSYNNNNYTLSGVAQVNSSSHQVTSILSFYENGVALTPTSFGVGSQITSPGTGQGYTSAPVGSPNFNFTINYVSSLYGGSSSANFMNGDASTVSNTNYGGGYAATVVSVSSGAPEIDGSLAPKVGFLLGCLFLMFGRKKQHTEALITV